MRRPFRLELPLDRLVIAIGLAMVALSGSAGDLKGQQQDSIPILLASASIQDRSDGIEWLLSTPTAEWTAGVRQRVVELLTIEGEAMLGASASGEASGEVAGHYHINLVKAALRLDDPTALRGLVTLGMKVSGRAERYVASRGAEALPELQRAYSVDDGLKVPVVQVVGMILRGGHSLGEQDSMTALAMLMAASGYEISYLSSVGAFPEFYGAVAWAADSAPIGAQRDRAARALSDFTTQLGQAPATELWRREMALLNVICSSGPGPRTHCLSSQNAGHAAQGHLDAERWGPARNTVTAVLAQLSQACSRAEIPVGGCRILIPGGRQVLTRLP